MSDPLLDGTRKLYYEDAYAKGFTARVISCREKKPEKGQDKNVIFYEAILDQTLFFPEEGGQSPDLGTINKIPVINVQIRDGIIVHTLTEPLTEGAEVGGIIDWNRRFSNMQQHSGEHIFSGLVHGKFGYDNVGFHLSSREVTLDFNGMITQEEILELERKANEVIYSNIEVVVSYPSKEEEKNIDYRSKIEISGQTRLVTFPGVDVCACCAPHVRRTGEIGLLKVVSMQNYKGGVRVSILCGRRALALFENDHASVTKVANFLTTSPDEIEASVTNLKSENQRLKTVLKKAAAGAMKKMADEVPADQKNVLLFTDGADPKAVREAVNLLVGKHDGFCGVFSGSDAEGYAYIIGSRTGDSRTLCSLLAEKFSARGGGRPEMVQGSLQAAEEELRRFWETL